MPWLLYCQWGQAVQLGAPAFAHVPAGHGRHGSDCAHGGLVMSRSRALYVFAWQAEHALPGPSKPIPLGQTHRRVTLVSAMSLVPPLQRHVALSRDGSAYGEQLTQSTPAGLYRPVGQRVQFLG